MGEKECQDCGLIVVTEPFDQTVSLFTHDGEIIRHVDKTLGSKPIHRYERGKRSHVDVGLGFSKMLMSSLTNSKSQMDRVENAYMTCFRAGIFGQSTYEDRASALVYYVLRERNLPFTLKEVCSEYGANPKLVTKVAKKISKHFKNSGVFVQSLDSLLEKYSLQLGDRAFANTCSLLLSFFEKEYEMRTLTLSKSAVAGILYIANLCEFKQLTQKEVGGVVGVSNRTCRDATKKLLRTVGKTESEIKGQGTQWIW